MIKPATLDVVEGKTNDLKPDQYHAFLKGAFAALNENGKLEINFTAGDQANNDKM